MRVLTLLALAFMLVGFLIALHQFIYWETWFDIEDVHHETLVIACAAIAGTLFGVSHIKLGNQPKRD